MRLEEIFVCLIFVLIPLMMMIDDDDKNDKK